MLNAAAAPAAVTSPVFKKPLPKVRLATREDLFEIISLGRELHKENGLMAMDEEAISKAATNAVLGTDGVVGVIGAPGHIEGLIFLQLRQFWYSNEMHLEELLNFVKPQYRRSENAKALIEFAKTAATRLDVPLLIGVLSNGQTEAKIRLYRRQLGQPAGAFFLFGKHTGKTKV
jgi:hypothetical protein